MEFLTTYGWAILILIIVILAFANFFLFKSKSAGQGCIPIAPFGACDVNLKEGTGTGINQISARFTDEVSGVILTDISIKVDGTTTCTTVSDATALTSGTTSTFTCAPSPGTGGKAYTGDITLSYVAPSGLTKQVTMQVGGTILAA